MFANVLSQNAQDALALLSKSNCLPKNTYLAGGSALALQYGHRISVDFDFFTPSSFNEDKMTSFLMSIGDFKKTEKNKNTLLGDFNQVKFSLFRYQYQLVSAPLNFLGINIASPQDIMVMKLAAIMDRGTKKDFIDIYFLIKNGISIKEGFSLYDKKYKALVNNKYSLIKGLAYFEDADKLAMPEMITKVDWEEVKDFFRKEIIKLADEYFE